MRKLIILLAILLPFAAMPQEIKVIQPYITANKVVLDSNHVDSTQVGSFWWSGTDGLQIWNGSAWVDASSGSGGTTFWSSTGNYVYPTTLTDYVGIGTATPTEILDVEGNQAVSDTSKLNIVSATKIGINETDPDAPLHVSTTGIISGLFDGRGSTVDEATMVVRNPNGGAGSTAGIGFVTSTNMSVGAGIYVTRNNTPAPGGQVMNFDTWLNASTMSLWDGKVGIGTETPTEKLHVVGNATLTGSVTISTTAQDTTVTAVKGKMVFKSSDSTFYGCRSTVAAKKWYKLNP